MKNSTAIVIAFIILTSVWFFMNRYNASKDSKIYFPSSDNINAKDNNGVATSNNSEIKEGIQYITIIARGGYSPRSSVAKSGMPTKLIIKTNGTYDCSSALVIRSLNYRNMLPNTGDTIIDAGTPKTGDILRGVCSMGMYSFSIAFD